MLPEVDTSSPSSSKARLSAIEVVEVNRDNLVTIWPYLLVSIKNADYVAVDLELSGLGSRSHSNSKNVEERYLAIRDAASTRSVLSIGIAVFKLEKTSNKKRRLVYKSQVFNILTLCSDPFVIEPQALEFLAKHSFDFNRLVKTGVLHKQKPGSPLCSLFNELFSSSIPLFLHNGLVDIAFIFHHFYSPLPESFGEFCNALSDLFPPTSPIVDAKYLAEYQSRMKASFLEYVFRKCQRENVLECESGRWYSEVRFDDISKSFSSLTNTFESVSCELPPNFPQHSIPADLSDHVCAQFSNHGFCRKQSLGKCLLLHDVDLTLDLEHQRQEKERKKRKRRFDHLKPGQVLEEERLREEAAAKARTETLSAGEIKERTTVAGCHRAGVDAFMTGYAVLFQSRLALSREDGKLQPEYCNRLPLSGKQDGLTIQRSRFSVDCPRHQEQFFAVESARKRKDNQMEEVPPIEESS